MSEDLELESLEEAIQDCLPDGHVLTGWAIVVESASMDGQLWLRRRGGPEGVATWRQRGLLHEALREDWAPDDED